MRMPFMLLNCYLTCLSRSYFNELSEYYLLTVLVYVCMYVYLPWCHQVRTTQHIPITNNYNSSTFILPGFHLCRRCFAETYADQKQKFKSYFGQESNSKLQALDYVAVASKNSERCFDLWPAFYVAIIKSGIKPRSFYSPVLVKTVKAKPPRSRDSLLLS